MYSEIEKEASDRDYDSIQENAGTVTAPKSTVDLLTTIPKSPAGFAIHYCINCFGIPPMCTYAYTSSGNISTLPELRIHEGTYT